MSNIYYLKATSETAMWEAMEAQGIAYKEYDPFDPANQEPIDNPVDWEPSGAYTWKATGDIDLIGTIYVVTGQDPEGRDIYGPLDDFYYCPHAPGDDRQSRAEHREQDRERQPVAHRRALTCRPPRALRRSR